MHELIEMTQNTGTGIYTLQDFSGYVAPEKDFCPQVEDIISVGPFYKLSE